MAKSNRRRKLDRTKRHARDSQQQAAARRRQEWRQGIKDMVSRIERLTDPSTPMPDLVQLFNLAHGGTPVPATAVRQMQGFGWSMERLTEFADFMLASGDADGCEPSLTALTWAAQVALATGEVARARQLLDRALAASTASDSRSQEMLSDHLRVSGRLADAIVLLEASLRQTPDDDFGAEAYGAAISEAYLRVNGQSPAGGCSCGLAAAWAECCGPRERAALDRFTDRSGLIALTDAVSVFLSGSEHGRVVDDYVVGLLAGYDDLDWETGDLASFRALLAERTLIAGQRTQADQGDEDDEEQDEAVSPIGAFAADPSVPGELAARAKAWGSHIRYGLWKVENSPPAPGLWCTDICTGVVRHAEFPARFTDGWPRWSVWLGGIVPVDGIWRATGAGLRLSPAEADAAAEYVDSAVISIVHSLAGSKPPPRPYNYLRIGAAEPVGVLAEQQDPMSSDLASITRIVVGELLPRLVGEVHMHRLANPPGRDPDRDELDLITAEIAVNDSKQASDRLATRPGFERDPDNPDLITWYAIGVPDPENPAAPQRWVRGTLDVDDGQIVAAVSSAEWLDRLLEVLSKIGADPVVIKEQRIDSAADSVLPEEKYWLDEELSALGGQTPRQAAAGEEPERLEALLRQFEYEADLLAAQGLPGIDTAWLRQELAMDCRN